MAYVLGVNVRLRVDRPPRAARVGGMITALVSLGWVCLVAGGVLVVVDSRRRRRRRRAAKAVRRVRRGSDAGAD